MTTKINKFKKSRCIKYPKDKISSFYKIINEEFDIISKVGTEDNNANITSVSDDDSEKLYTSKYSHYLHHEFNNTIVNMIILYINKINSFPLYYKNEPNFTYNMVSLFKHLLMNEIEVAYFTILLDNIGWKYENYEHWLYFNILGIITKKQCGNEEDFILLFKNLSRVNKKFIDEYSTFINDKKIISKIDENNISLKAINKRYLQLTKPVNSYCRKNIINYQDILDKIVKLSQPYFKESYDTKINDNNFKYDDKISINDNVEKKVKKNISNKIYKFEEQIYNINNQNEENSEECKLYGYGIQNKEDDYKKINFNIFNCDSIDFLQYNDD